MLNTFLPFKSTFKYEPIDLKGYRSLIITTSQRTLDKYDTKTNSLIKSRKKTGVYASEMTEPYYTFLDAGMAVDVASILGGPIPIDPLSMIFPARTKEDSRFMKDSKLQKKVAESIALSNINIEPYDIIFMSGGWGAAYDFAQSSLLSDLISQAYRQNKILTSVCHGALGFIGAIKKDGEALVKDVQVTGVTNRQLKHLMITCTPKHPEEELRKAGADYQCRHGMISDLFASYVVVDEKHRMVSGQNQKCGVEVAYRAMMLLKDTPIS